VARLDRLGPAREVAQLGAVLGRQFPYALLRAVFPLGDDALRDALAALVEAEVLFVHGHDGDSGYLFKHALLRDAAYELLLKAKRQQLHGQIADTLRERFVEAAEAQPEILAHHYTEAGRHAEAIAFWRRAGARAMQRFANAEAIRHLCKALELLAATPDTPERSREEIDLQILLASPIIASRGYGAPEVATAYERARALSTALGDTRHEFTVLRGLER